ncbi:MAG: DUF2325 domain-containing protein [Euryarchaeota archaeon]|nr:DUF2325 domain-containing protein [Euryarchaeota archaeon]
MPERKIWELKNQTVCSILGLTYSDKELSDIFKRLKLDCNSVTAYEMHGGLIQACSSQNKTSKQLDRILKDRFERYKKDIERIPQEEIYKHIEDGSNGNGKDTPISALIWFAVRNQREDIDAIEAAVFAATHMYEHRASRFYGELRRTLPCGVPENLLMELTGASKANEKLRTKCNRLERKREQLKSEIESVREDRLRITSALDEEKRLNRQLVSDLEGLGGEDTLNQTENMKKEIDFLTSEVKRLTDELLSRDRSEGDNVKSGELVEIEHRQELDIMGERGSADLNGAKVAYIGGVESLMPYYRDAIESVGGTFCYHCGRCIQGRKEIETIVDGIDMVFCPVDINSHNACKYVKKACKMRDKPCHFLRSSSLSMLIRELGNRAVE